MLNHRQPYLPVFLIIWYVLSSDKFPFLGRGGITAAGQKKYQLYTLGLPVPLLYCLHRLLHSWLSITKMLSSENPTHSGAPDKQYLKPDLKQLGQLLWPGNRGFGLNAMQLLLMDGETPQTILNSYRESKHSSWHLSSQTDVWTNWQTCCSQLLSRQHLLTRRLTGEALEPRLMLLP